MVLPLKRNLFCRTFEYCFLFLKILLKGIRIFVNVFLGHINIIRNESVKKTLNNNNSSVKSG